MLCCVPGLPFRTGVSFPTAGKVVPEAEPPPREAVLSGTRRELPRGQPTSSDEPGGGTKNRILAPRPVVSEGLAQLQSSLRGR